MGALADGRAAIDKGAWASAYALLSAADAETPLEPEDLDRLARAADLIGRDTDSIAAWTRAHAGFLERGDRLRAAASAFWLAFGLVSDPSSHAQAAGWLARSRRLLDEANVSCVEQGWHVCASALQCAQAGKLEDARVTYEEAAAIGDRFGCADLVALARHGQGRCLLDLGRRSEGLALLDEVMIAVTGGEIAPRVAGIVYCSVISACQDLFDLRRAHEWTTALHRWCTANPDVVPFRSSCLVHRSEVMQLSGAWPDALEEARRACEHLRAHERPADPGASYYQLAELLRLRGEFEQAEEAYRLASQAGRKPQPGLALLRFAQGHDEAADAAIRLALRETRGRRSRVHLLAAAVDIALARRDLAAARAAVVELAALARDLDAPFPAAKSAHAQGAVALSEGQAEPALASLDSARSTWQELDVPYELARVRMLIGLAYRQLGDEDGAQLEFDAAQETFERLGAAPDAARAAALAGAAERASSGGLTGREIEVLRLIATGATNRAIAGKLNISEKTVARHLSNIFTKLDLPSRSAATAYAYEHKLV